MTDRAESPTAAAVAKAEKKKIICGSCYSDLELDHTGIQCVQGHHFCPGCSINIVNLFFSDPQQYTPLRCLQCHIELNPGVFERQLTHEQLDFYNQNMLFLVYKDKILQENERLDSCPCCPYAIICGKDDPKFMYCLHPECSKVSCLVCHKAWPLFNHDYYDNDEQETEMERHFTCARLEGDKILFDKALESGQKVPCPNCGLAGMKDDACTHMTCPTCSQLWCYLCGKKVEDCDKYAGGTNSIYDHNHSWEFNPKRCPMYLTQINELDDRWPDGDEDLCLMMFHRIRSLTLLRNVYHQLGQERINALNNHFRILTTCGFTLREILEEDLTFIKYGDTNPRVPLRRDD